MPQTPFTARPNIVAVYDVWVESQSVANNTSVIRRQLRAVEVANQQSWDFSSLGWGSSVAGQGAGGTWSFDFRPGGNQEYWLQNDTITVGHNADGTMAVWCDASIQGGVLGSAGFGFTLYLPTIPRATNPTVSGAATAGVAFTISTAGRASTAFTHTLKYAFGTSSGTIATGVATSQSWTPPLALLNEIPNNTSGVGTITCETYNGGSLIGTRSIPFTLNAASNIIPTMTASTITDLNTTVVSNIGAFVKGESLIKAVVNSAGVYGSTIAASAFTFEGVTVPSAGSVLAATAGTRPVTAATTDSRGRTATRNDNVTVLAYTPPQITALQVRRATSAGVLDNMGVYLRLDLTAAIQSLIVASVQKNSMTIKVETKPRLSSTWTVRNEITAALSYNTNVLISGGGTFAQGTSYDVRVTVSDKLKSMVGMTVVSTAVVALHLGTGLGVNKLWEQGGIDVTGEAYVDGIRLARINELPVKATAAEVAAGTDDTKFVTSLQQTLGASGLLAGDYRGYGPAKVYLDGGTTLTSVDWATPYIPWGSRRVNLTRTAGRWVITGQTQYESVTGGHKVIKLTPAANWALYNKTLSESIWADGPYATQLPSGLVVLSGLIRYTAGVPANTSQILSGLPVGMRPSHDLMHYVNNSDTSKYLWLRANGTIEVGASFVSNGYISLDGIAFWPAGVGTWTNIATFGANFEARTDAGWPAPSYWKDPYGFVWFRGVVKIKTATSVDGTLIANIPADHRPAADSGGGYRHLITAGNGVYAGIGVEYDVAGTNGLQWKMNSPGTVNTWITLSGLVYPSETATSLAENLWTPISYYANAWSRYDAIFPVPGFMRRKDGLVIGKGLIGSGSVGSQLRAFMLEQEMWPNQGRLIVDTMAANGRARLDVSGVKELDFQGGKAPGSVAVVNGSATWLTLDGVKWVTSP